MERASFRRRLEIQVAAQSRGEILVRANRPGRVPRPLEQRHELAKPALVLDQQLRRASCACCGGGDVAGALLLLREGPAGVGRAVSQSQARLVEPFVECRRAVDRESRQQLATIREQGIGETSALQGILELRGVALESSGVHADAVGASRRQDVRAQRLSQLVQRLAQ